MSNPVIATMITTTSYGSWLPGDMRGYVEDGEILPSNPELFRHARSRMKGTPVHFSTDEQHRLVHAILAAASEFRYRLSDLAVESWRLHWIIEHEADPAEVMVGRLKTRMRQTLARGRIWTEGYCHRYLFCEADMDVARNNIARHPGCRMLNFAMIGAQGDELRSGAEEPPGRAGG